VGIGEGRNFSTAKDTSADYADGKKYCSCVFCPCCGMALRITSTSKTDKERLARRTSSRE